jgi:aminocarboxymuconate-semialdehyde decarboxylase
MAGVAGTDTKAQPSEAALRVIDFHNHYVGPAFPSRAGAGAPSSQQARFQEINRKLSDPQALISSIEEAGIVARVISTPIEFLQDADGDLSPSISKRVNDQLAELVSRNPGRLYALATVDAYSGEAGARELTRAVRELGLRGVFVQAAKSGSFLDAPQARPTLAAAAALQVPVFIHPISDKELGKRFSGLGRLGLTLNRGTINTAALFALLESRTFDELPRLHVAVTTLAIGGLLLAGGFGDGFGLRQDTPAADRRHVYIDTMGLHPALIRAAVGLVGFDHVLAGTDWPIFTETAVTERLRKSLTACGLDATQQQMIASGNTARLLGVA